MNCHHCGKYIDLEMSKNEEDGFQREMDSKNVVPLCIDCYVPEVAVKKEDDIVYRLRKRAEIRRSITTRKSVQMGERDRLADLLDEAATHIQSLEQKLNEFYWKESQ